MSAALADMQKLRELYRRKKARTSGTLLSDVGRAKSHSEAERRWRVIRDMSDQGATIEQAATAVGLKVAAVKHHLYRHTGSTLWPIKGGE